MARPRRSVRLVGTTLVSLRLLLGASTASVITRTLAQMPVSGRLANGGDLSWAADAAGVAAR